MKVLRAGFALRDFVTQSWARSHDCSLRAGFALSRLPTHFAAQPLSRGRVRIIRDFSEASFQKSLLCSLCLHAKRTVVSDGPEKSYSISE